MPQVASEPVVQRPLRPEFPAGRADPPAGERENSFGTLLDTPAAPPAARPQRVTRNRPAERLQAPDDRTEAPASHHAAKHAKAKSDENSAKTAPAANDVQPSNAAQPVADVAAATLETGGAPAADFTAVDEAMAADATSDPEPEKADDTPATADQAADPGADAGAVSTDTKTTDGALAVIATGVAPVPVPAMPVAATADPTVAPVAIEATAAPAAPDAPRLDTSVFSLSAADAPDTGKASAASQTIADAKLTPTGQSASSDDPASAIAATTASPVAADGAKGAKPRALTDLKNEPEKAKSEHASVTREANATPRPDAAKPDADDQAAKPIAAHDARPQSIEHASATARVAVAQSHADLPPNAAAPAQANSAAPNVPFLLAALSSLPLPNLLPVTALRLDPAADNAVPVAGLAVEIVSRAQDGLRRFDIRLDPPELGRIDVRLDVDAGGKVTSRLTVERAETLDLLRRDAPQLERALQHAGLNTDGGLEFSLRDQNFANREQAPRDVPAARLIVPDDEPAAAEAVRRGYGRLIGLGGGIDIRV